MISVLIVDDEPASMQTASSSDQVGRVGYDIVRICL